MRVMIYMYGLVQQGTAFAHHLPTYPTTFMIHCAVTKLISQSHKQCAHD